MLYKLHLRSHFWTNLDSEKSDSSGDCFFGYFITHGTNLVKNCHFDLVLGSFSFKEGNQNIELWNWFLT